MSEKYLYDMLFQMLPDCLKDSKVYREILKAYACMLKAAWDMVERTARNIYLDTAVESLPLHARDLNISIEGMSLGDAREVIRSAYWALAQVVKEGTIVQVADAHTNGGLKVVRTDEPGRYIFEFTSVYGIPAQLETLDKIFKRMIGTEYVWDYKYKYMTWGEREAYSYTEGEWAAKGLTVSEELIYNER